MPFYEYECSNCKFYTEVMQKITDAPMTKCPSCGKKALKKLVSAPNFRLKGGGWYETDFKGDKENKRNLAGECLPADALSSSIIWSSKRTGRPAGLRYNRGPTSQTDNNPCRSTNTNARAASSTPR